MRAGDGKQGINKCWPKNGTNSVEVVYKENMAKFTVAFHNDHLDVDRQLQDEQLIHSHGLMG